jgi:hypothetical protein
MFLWCWDARPYPHFPHSKVWADHAMWERGHWINGKLGNVILGDVIKSLITTANIDHKAFNARELDQSISGMLIENDLNLWDIISILRCSYFFDIRQNESKIEFIKRGAEQGHELALKNIGDEFKVQESFDNSLKILLHFFNLSGRQISVSSDFLINGTKKILRLPLYLSEHQGRNIANTIVANCRAEDRGFSFKAMDYDIMPGDVLQIKNLKMRVLEVTIVSGSNMSAIQAISEDCNAYEILNDDYQPVAASNLSDDNASSTIIVKQIPPLPDKSQQYQYVVFFYSSPLKHQLYISFDEENFIRAAKLFGKSSIGKIIDYDNNPGPNTSSVDQSSYFIAEFPEPLEAFIQGINNLQECKNIALIGDEIVSYGARENQCSLQGIDNKYVYKFSLFKRGELNTKIIQGDEFEKYFLLLDQHCFQLPLELQCEKFQYKYKNNEISFELQKFNLSPTH